MKKNVEKKIFNKTRPRSASRYHQGLRTCHLQHHGNAPGKAKLPTSDFAAYRASEIWRNQGVLHTTGIERYVDPEIISGATAYSKLCSACWRVSDGASTMQIELVANIQALHLLQQHRVGPVTIHMVSKSTIQVLHQTKVAENRTSIVHLK